MELTSLHLSRIGQLYPQPLLELGPNIVEIPEEFSDIVDEQLTAAGVLESADTLAAPARALLDPLFGYDQAFAAVLMLHNQRQRVTFDLDEEWFDYIGSTSIPTTPRVYVLVTATGSTVTTAVRAGDHVDVVQEVVSEEFPKAAAAQLLRVGDPGNEWSPASIASVSFPADLLDRAPLRAPTTDSEDRQARADHRETVYRFVGALRGSGVSSRTVSTVETILGLDHIAANHVSYISGPRRLLSEGSASIDYFHNAGIVVSGVQKMGDGRVWKTFAPATRNDVAAALSDLTRLPSRPMLDALSSY
ncbi:hypothetical protein GS896_25360 [Rhodococcus hoagii]|nr:hypothetical protein [Prescottella equi]NKR23438.1 hypothetical protein [Prescottella equi]NKT55950.1 hypothetical protein [Prescottella equi]NKZ79702.1 hypothetical protein [Prescottella equi]